MIENLPVGEAVTLNCSYVIERADANATIRNAAAANGTTPAPEDPKPEPKEDETEGRNVENIYNLTIHYVYAAGGIAAPDVTGQYLAGEAFGPFNSPEIEGYAPDYRFVRSDVKGMPARDVEFTVVYTAVPAVSLVPLEPAAPVPGAAIVPEGDGGVDVVPVMDEEVPLANRELAGHLCCIMHFLLMMLALLVYVFYTKSMKRQQARVAKLRDEFETESPRRRLGLDR